MEGDWVGTHDNTAVVDNTLILASDDAVGNYEDGEIINLDGLYPVTVSAAITANGTYINDIFEITDIFAEPDIFGVGGADFFSYKDLFNVDDVFGIGNSKWTVQLQFSITTTDPTDSPPGWTALGS